MMTLLHHMANEKHIISLFENCSNLADWVKKVPTWADFIVSELPFKYNEDLKNKDIPRKIAKGSCFELFCEILVKSFGTHLDIGLDKYNPINPDEDYGVDAYAINSSSEATAIQCKFSHSRLTLYNGDDGLNSFFAEARNNRYNTPNIELTDSVHSTLVFFTTGAGIHQLAREKKFNNNIRSIGFHQISNLVNNNYMFWENSIAFLKETIK